MISILVCELSYDTGLKKGDILLRYDGQGVMPALPAEKKSAPGGIYLCSGMEKRVFARSVAEHLIPWNGPICSSNEATSGAAAANKFTIVVKLTIIHCHSSEPIFLSHRPKWDCWMEMWWESPILHLLSPQWLHCSLQSLQKCGIIFWLTIFLNRERVLMASGWPLLP